MLMLQINTTGAWRNVLAFPAPATDQVLRAVRILAAVAPSAKWCVLDGDGHRSWIDPETGGMR
ncbi:MAG TPA: hypothetical protein DCZ11_05315 [Gammaproteobacteria bacterium]|nr:hypothetical protein [Gammaproteobacteria bacterium]MCH77841.1 hypothetical protein [Gammaproteobacteria bacterium]